MRRRAARIPIAVRAAPLALVLWAGCKGPAGPVVRVTLDRARDLEVLQTFHGIDITVVAQGEADTVRFPEGGPTLAPLELPTDLALVASDVEGVMAVHAVAVDPTGRPIAEARATVRLEEPELYDLTMALGVSAGCGDRQRPVGRIPEVCFRRAGMEMVLGGGEDKLGNISNGVDFVFADPDATADLIAVWSEDFNDQTLTQKSGVSLYFGDSAGGEGVRYGAEADQLHLVDNGDIDAERLGDRRSNTEGTVGDVIDPEGGPPDGEADLVVSSLGVKGVSIWPRRARRAYAGRPVFVDLGVEPGELKVRDLLPERPGSEIVVALRKETTGFAVVGRTDGQAALSVLPVEGMETPTGIRGFEVADLDGDGDLDIASAAKGQPGANPGDPGVPGGLRVHLNEGGGRFTTSQLGPDELGPHDVRAADLDGDGKLDLVAVNQDRGVVALHRGTGGGEFELALEYSLLGPDGAPQSPDRVRFGDLDGDGIVDVLVCGLDDSLHMLLVGADGQLRFPVIRVPGGEQTGELAEDLQGCDGADTDGDGIVDRIAIVDRLRKRLRVLVEDP